MKTYANLPVKTFTTTSPPHTNSQLKNLICLSGGFLFRQSDVIDEGYLSSTKTCWQIRCGKTGRFIKSTVACEKLERNKLQAVNEDDIATTKPPKSGCIFNGLKYESGENIQTLSDWQYDRCYGTRCNTVGEIVAWEHFNCYSTPPYTTTTDDVSTTSATTFDSSSTMFPTTTDTPLDGCYDNSVLYHPGEEISYEYLNENQTCIGKYCNFNYKIVSWQSKNCHHTSSPTPTTDLVTDLSDTTTTEEGCYVNGQYFKLNSKIDSANDGVSWCFGHYCNENSRVVYWDDFNCDVTKQETADTKTLKSIVEVSSHATDKILQKIDLKIKNKLYSTVYRKSKTKVKNALEKFFANFPFYKKSR